MKHWNRAIASGALLLALGAVVTACNGGSSTASSGPTMAEFNALKAQVQTLQTELGTLQTQYASLKNVASLKLAVSSASNPPSMNGAVTYATSSTTTSSCAWTLSGYPKQADPMNSNVISATTCDGYYVDISEAGANGQGLVRPLQAYAYYTGTGCTGTAYVGNLSSTAAVLSGFVFVLDPTNPSGYPADYTNAAYYWYVPAGEAATTLTSASVWQPGSGCNPSGSAVSNVYQMMQNDSTVTGVASAPRPGPVLPTSP